MERLAKTEPKATPLSPAQKARLAELDTLYKGKWAERQVFLKEQLEKALGTGEADEAEQLRVQLAREKIRIDEECEEAKERVRREARR